MIFNDLFDNTEYYIWVVDKEDRILECNHLFAELLESPEDSIVSKKTSEFIEEVYTNGYQKIVKLKNGKTFKKSVYFELHDKIYNVGTEISFSAQELHQINYSIQKTSGIGFAYYDIPTEQFYYSPLAAKLLGLEKGSNHELNDFYDIFVDKFKSSMKERTKALIEEDISFDKQAQIKRDSGIKIWVRVVGKAETKFMTASRHRVYFILQDIDVYKRTELEVMNSRLNTQLIIDNIPEAVVLTDSQGVIKNVNMQLFDIFGYSTDEIIGQSVNLLMSEKVAKHHSKYMQKYLETGESNIINVGRELEGRKKSGEVFPIYLALGDMITDGNRVFIGIIRDLSEAKDLQEKQLKLENEIQQARKLESVMTMAGCVAHDFNNALTAIKGQIQLMRIKNKDNEDVQQRAEMIEKVVANASNLTSTILDFSRQGEIDGKEVDIHNILNISSEYVRPSLEEKDKIDTNFTDKDFILFGDAFILEQIFSNLMVNAFDAIRDNPTIEGGLLQISTEIKYVEDNQNRIGFYLMIHIKDNGAGIPYKLLKKIYDPFFTTKDVGKGTGLGLAFVFNAVNQHKGFIELETEVNQGTEFIIALPIKYSERAQ